MSAVEGIGELKLGAGLVPDLDLKAAECSDQPDLPGACPEGGVHHAARGEGGGGYGIIHVYQDHDSRRVG